MEYSHTIVFLVFFVIASVLIGAFLNRLIVNIPKSLEEEWLMNYAEVDSEARLFHFQSRLTKVFVVLSTSIGFGLVFIKVGTYFDLLIWLYSFLMFAIVSLWLLGTKKYHAEMMVPFGPFLIFATMLVLFFNQPFIL